MRKPFEALMAVPLLKDVPCPGIPLPTSYVGNQEKKAAVICDFAHGSRRALLSIVSARIEANLRQRLWLRQAMPRSA